MASPEDQTSILDSWGRVLNGLAADSRLKITLANRLFNKDSLSGSVFYKKKDDGLDRYRGEMNRVLMDKAKGSNGIVQEKFLTLTANRKNENEARMFFSRAGKSLSFGMQRLSSTVKPLNNTERFRVLHDFFRPDHRMKNADVAAMMRSGKHFADVFCPLAMRYHADYIELDRGFARVLFIEEYASMLPDKMVHDLMELPRQMMLSIDITPVHPQEAVKMLNRLDMRVESDITRWQQRQNNNNNFSAEIPYEYKQMREVVENYKDETTQNDQRIMMTTTTVVHMADTLEQLNADTETLKTTASGYGCELAALKWQQDIGLDTVLPYGLRRVVQQRTLLTKSASILTPFSAQEIQQTGGICYGNNAVSGNMILANRALLKNGNCIRLGVPGAGKSMSAKWEIGQVLLSTNDDVLILDPENEFTPMVGAFGGTMIDVSGSSAVRINAMDMEKGYADNDKNPLADKSEFIMSLFEQIMGDDVNARHRSIIDRCIKDLYLSLIHICVMLFIDSQGKRRPGEEHGSARWGKAKQVCAKYRYQPKFMERLKARISKIAAFFRSLPVHLHIKRLTPEEQEKMQAEKALRLPCDMNFPLTQNVCIGLDVYRHQRNLNICVAVSYTHLDVYKRQV